MRFPFFVLNFIFVLLFSGLNALALEPVERVEDPVPDETKAEATSRQLRGFSPWAVHAQLSTASLIVPLKPGLAVTWNYSPSWSFEAGIMRGSLSAGIAGQDIGSYTETSYQLLARHFGDSNSFNFIYGVSKETGGLSLGNKYVNFATGMGDIDVASLSSYAVSFGVGNRWQWENRVSFGVDWFTLTMPVKVNDTNSDFFDSTASQNDKQQVQDILDFFARVPRFSICHLSVGYSF